MLSDVDDFYIKYSVSGENLEEPFIVLIHVHFKREQANAPPKDAR